MVRIEGSARGARGWFSRGGEKVIVLRWGCFVCVPSSLPHVPNEVAEASGVVDRLAVEASPGVRVLHSNAVDSGIELLPCYESPPGHQGGWYCGGRVDVEVVYGDCDFGLGDGHIEGAHPY